MIIWKKLGILGLIIPVGFAAILQLLLGDYASLAGIGYLSGGIIVWYLGKKWNENIDRKNSQNIPVAKISKHSMFWIHLEYWGVFFGLIGITILLTENIFDIGTDPTLIIWGLGLIALIAFQVFKNFNQDPKSTEILDSPEYATINKFQQVDKKIETEKKRAEKVVLKEYKTTDHSKYMPKPKE